MKKAKRYAAGGMTQADIDAGLTQEMFDAGMRGGRNERISDDDRMRARMNAEREGFDSVVDQYRNRATNPDAQAFPVDLGGSRTPAPRPRATPSAAPRARAMPVEMPEESASASPGVNRSSREVPEAPAASAAPRRAPPSRGSYDRPGPIGDLIDIIRNSARRGSGNPNPKIYRGTSEDIPGAKKGGAVKKMASGGSVSSASKRGDGIASRGKTKGRMC